MPVYFGPNLVLLDRLAAGGMGEVYRARQTGTGGFQKTVAVKRILPQYASRADFAHMFQQEMNLCAKLQHPNIVQVFSNGREGGYLYLVMEFVNGKSVAELFVAAKRRKLRIPPEVSCFIISEAAQGLAYAHSLEEESNGEPLHIVHRDVSPQNIMLGFGGEVKVVDFGIAKAADRLEREKSGELKGKIPYAAPEYLNGAEPDHRGDIFGLGVVFHELLSQHPLFSAETPYETIKNVLEKPIPSLVEQYPDVRFEIEAIVRRALERDPNERYQSAAEMYRAIAVFANKAYPNFTRAEFAKSLETLLISEDDASVARLRDLYGYAKEVPAQLVNAETDPLQEQPAEPTILQKSIDFLLEWRLILFPAVLVALVLFALIGLNRQQSIPDGSAPTEVENLLAWFSPEYMEHDRSGRIAAWKDAGWLGNSAIQLSEEHRPAISEERDELRSLHFDGNRYLLVQGAAESLTRAKGITIIIVAKSAGRQGSPQALWAAQTADKAGSIMRGGLTFGIRLNLQLMLPTAEILSQDSAPLHLTEWAVYSFVLSLKKGVGYQNGAETVIASSPAPLPFDRIGIFLIGQAYKDGTDSDFFEGDIAEVVIYSKALTDADRSSVERFLAKKYSIRLTPSSK